jgi:uncharacterized membrane protein YkoI
MKSKPNTKRAAIGSLMNTMGRVGGNQKKMKPMAISASNLSNKPPKQPQLGDPQGNRFMQQSNALQAKTASSASPVDVSPYLTSTAHKSSDLSGRPYTEQPYTSQLYTKLASMESMLTKTIPGLFKALPDQYTSPVTKAIQTLKEKLTPPAQAPAQQAASVPAQPTAFSEGIKGLTNAFSNFRSQTPPAPQVPQQPAPAPVQQPAPAAAPQPAPVPVNQAPPPPAQPVQPVQPPVQPMAGPGSSRSYVPKPVGNVSTKQQELMGETGAQPAPMVPKYEVSAPTKTYDTNAEMQRRAAEMDLQGRYNKAGLGADAKALPPEQTYQQLAEYISTNRAKDLYGLPPQHRAAFDAMPKPYQDNINRMLSDSTVTSILTSPSESYQPAFWDKSIDNAVLSAAEPLNSITNTVKAVPTALGITNDQKTFSNLDTMRGVIGASGAADSLGRDIAALDTKIRRDAQNGTSDPKDMAELNRLIAARRVSEGAISSADLNAKDTMPLFDNNLGFGQKLLAGGSDLLGTFFPTMTAAQSAARFGLNSADVQNADAKADLLGLLAPRNISSAAKTIKTMMAPRAALSGARDYVAKGLTDFKNLPWYHKLWKAPMAPVNALTSNLGMKGLATASTLATPSQPSMENQIREQSLKAVDDHIEAGRLASEQAAKADADRSRLYKYLLGAGLGIPAIMAIMGSMGRKPDEEPEDDEEGDESPGAANVKP